MDDFQLAGADELVDRAAPDGKRAAYLFDREQKHEAAASGVSLLDAIGLLAAVSQRPVRVGVVSLAAAKRAVDEVRKHKDDRHLLADIAHILRDQAAMTGTGVADGLDDFRSGRVTRLDQARLDELLPPMRTKRSSST